MFGVEGNPSEKVRLLKATVKAENIALVGSQSGILASLMQEMISAMAAMIAIARAAVKITQSLFVFVMIFILVSFDCVLFNLVTSA